jgi:tetratricopeptide (TPR) repeat protein
MADHPPRSWTTGFIRGKISPRKRRAVIGHLLGGCDACRQEIAPITRVMFHPGRAVEPVEGGAEYDGPVDRAMLFAVERQQERMRERAEAEVNLSRILHEDWQSIRDSRELWTWGLCEVLLERISSFRHEDAREMLRLAGLAREAADRLDPKVYGEEQVVDMRARSWGEFASACRHQDNLAQAEWSIQRALELYKQGSGSPMIRARLSEITAGILCHQRHFQPALRALDLSFSLYVCQSQMRDALRVLIGRGIHTGRSGDPELALLILARALVFSAEHKVDDPKLTFITLHNILLFRVERGEFTEARRQLFEMRPLYARHAGAVDSLKLRWIEAKIAAGLGDDERAEKGFQEVREEFNRRGQVYHAAIMGLELAALWLRQGRLADVKRMVGEILEVFRSRHVARETIAALLVLREAVERDRASQELILGVASLIELHQADSLDHAGSPQP